MGVPSIERDGYPFFGFWKNRTRTSNSTPIYHFSFAAFEEFSKRHFTSNVYFTDSEVVLIDHRYRTVYRWCSEKPAFDCYDTSWVSDSLSSTKLRMCSKMYACIMNYTIWPHVLWLWFLIYRLLCYRDGNIQISREGTFNLHANELYILQSFVRTKTDLLELKSHVIYVLKRVVNNRWIKSNRFFLENKRLKKTHLLLKCQPSLKHVSKRPDTDIFYCSLRLKITRAWCWTYLIYTRCILECNFSDGVKRERSRSIKVNSPSAMNTLKETWKQKTEKIAPPFYSAAKLIS